MTRSLGAVTQSLCVDEVRGKENTVEYLAVLIQQENNLYPPCDDYLSELPASPSSSNDSDPVSESWRRKLCEWCYEVVDHFKFDREAVSVALDYLDRSVSKWTKYSDVAIPKKEFQLLAVTSLYMAIKIHGETDCAEGPRRKLKIDAFYELSRKQFEVEVIEKTERHILAALNWNVNPPTALKFIATYLALCPKWQNAHHHASHSSVLGGIYDVARYLTELSVCQSDFSFYCKTSVVAYASVLFAIKALHATLPLPYAVRITFLNSIAEATGLVSVDAEVLRVCDMLKKLCPNMFNGDDIPSEFRGEAQHHADICDDPSIDGKASPVCVIDEQQDQGARRKRSRSASEDSWRPIHRPSM
jgi:Cyclin, N-terminal domain